MFLDGEEVKGIGDDALKSTVLYRRTYTDRSWPPHKIPGIHEREVTREILLLPTFNALYTARRANNTEKDLPREVKYSIYF